MGHEQPRLIVVAGPNGSGKTTITDSILRHTWFEGCTYINPDFIARDDFGDWNSLDAVIKAAQKAAQIRKECLENRQSIAFETVLSVKDKIDFIKQAKDAGFFVRLFFIGTDHPAINASRIAHRVMEGGHDVPISKIISRYTRSIANCSVAATLADRTYIYDNSVDYAEPELMFRAVNGRIKKVYCEIHEWAQDIFSSLTP